MEDITTRKFKLQQLVTSKVKDEGIKKFTLACIDDFPNYFWSAPASGSGKYHPPDERIEGGLYLHTKRVVKVVEDLSRMHELSYYERDVLISAALLHDSFCKGLDDTPENMMTDAYHALYPTQMFPYKGFSSGFLPERVWDDIMACVVSHMGRWSIVKWMDVDKKLCNILKTADYIASRSHIIVNLD